MYILLEGKNLMASRKSVEDKLKHLAVLREEAKKSAALVKKLQDELIEELTEMDDTFETSAIRGVVVRSQSTSYDTVKMRELLPDATWVKVTDRVLSPEKLEDCISKGKLSVEDIIDAVVIKDRSPFVKITLKAGDA